MYVEFDDQEWEKREWVKVYEDFQLFLLEHQLVWAKRIEGAGAGGAAGGHLQGTKAKQIQWPALVSSLVCYRCFRNVHHAWAHSRKAKSPVKWLGSRLAACTNSHLKEWRRTVHSESAAPLRLCSIFIPLKWGERCRRLFNLIRFFFLALMSVACGRDESLVLLFNKTLLWLGWQHGYIM